MNILHNGNETTVRRLIWGELGRQDKDDDFEANERLSNNALVGLAELTQILAAKGILNLENIASICGLEQHEELTLPPNHRIHQLEANER